MKHPHLTIWFFLLGCSACFAHHPKPLTPKLNSWYGLKVAFEYKKSSNIILITLDYKEYMNSDDIKYDSFRASLRMSKNKESFIAVQLAHEKRIHGTKKVKYSFKCTPNFIDNTYICFYPVSDPPQDDQGTYFKLRLADWIQDREQDVACY